MEKITSRSNPKIKDAVAIKNDNSRFFLVEGFHCVNMAYEAGLLKTVFSTKEIDLKNVTKYLVTPEVLDKLSSTKTPEGIAGICDVLKTKELSKQKIVYLDNVQDPGNVGTILRTCLAFGYTDIILGEGCANVYNSKTILASQGSIFKLNIRKGNIEILSLLKKKGYKVISTSLKDSIPLKELDIKNNKIVIVFGNEGKGISSSILDISDIKVRIEMDGIDSLNVGVAAGITLYNCKNN